MIYALRIFLLLSFASLGGPCEAHFLWVNPIGSQTAGDQTMVTIEFYLHAETNDSLLGWGFDVGFDDADIDGDELTFVGFQYAPTNLLDATFILPPPTLVQGASAKYSGESFVRYFAKDAGISMTGDALTAGQDKLLFDITFIFEGGAADGEDVWIEFDPLGLIGFRFASNPTNPVFTLPVFSDNTGMTPLGDNGPDYATPPATSKSVPGASPLLLVLVAVGVGVASRRFLS